MSPMGTSELIDPGMSANGEDRKLSADVKTTRLTRSRHGDAHRRSAAKTPIVLYGRRLRCRKEIVSAIDWARTAASNPIE